MSRVGKKNISIPKGVTVTYENGVITVKGPKGELTFTHHPLMQVILYEDAVQIKRPGNEKIHKSLHGLTRSLVQNMVTGASVGFSRRLEVNGVGYRFQVQGNKLVLSLGYSHPIEFIAEKGIEVKADEEKKNVIIVSGMDKQKVGQAAAKIREFRKPEPYKGKGIKYEEEVIQRKAGKTAAKSS